MNIANARVLVTGATRGIGAATAKELVRRGADVLLTGRDEAALQRVARDCDPTGDLVGVIAADVRLCEDRRALADAARSWRGGVDVLINNAGVPAAGLFDDAHVEGVEHALAVNVLAPLHLCRLLLPHLSRLPDAHIVNIGSVFGAIGYPGHTVYCATKFALRGFSEALRRELSDTNVRVHYLAPRATRTPFNAGASDALNAELRVATDAPERVAAAICDLLERGRAERIVGWPESLFVRLNAVLPALLDRSLKARLPTIRRIYGRRPPPPVHPLPRNAS
jgi:short-subunit dehydrogenase